MLESTSFIVAVAWQLVPGSIGFEYVAEFGSDPVAVNPYGASQQQQDQSQIQQHIQNQ
jgi:hypothetical protein